MGPGGTTEMARRNITGRVTLPHTTVVRVDSRARALIENGNAIATIGKIVNCLTKVSM